MRTPGPTMMAVIGALCLAAAIWLLLSSSHEIMSGDVPKGGLFGLSLGVLVVVGLLLLCSGVILGAEGRERGGGHRDDEPKDSELADRQKD